MAPGLGKLQVPTEAGSPLGKPQKDGVATSFHSPRRWHTQRDAQGRKPQEARRAPGGCTGPQHDGKGRPAGGQLPALRTSAAPACPHLTPVGDEAQTQEAAGVGLRPQGASQLRLGSTPSPSLTPPHPRPSSLQWRLSVSHVAQSKREV